MVLVDLMKPQKIKLCIQNTDIIITIVNLWQYDIHYDT